MLTEAGQVKWFAPVDRNSRMLSVVTRVLGEMLLYLNGTHLGPVQTHLGPVQTHLGPVQTHLGPIPTHLGPVQ